MDRDEDGFLNFREFVFAIGMTSSADLTLRLKLLFTLHLPPLLTPAEIESPQQGKDLPELEQHLFTHLFLQTPMLKLLPKPQTFLTVLSSKRAVWATISTIA